MNDNFEKIITLSESTRRESETKTKAVRKTETPKATKESKTARPLRESRRPSALKRETSARPRKSIRTK